MAKNEVLAPGPACRKVSLPMTGTVNSGDPVKVGSLVGVAQTAVETADTDPPTSNAVGNASVWLDGAWRLPVTVATAALKIGDPIYCAVSGSNSAVTLFSQSATGRFLFGYALEKAAIGNATPTVLVVGFTGAAAA